MTNNLTVNGIGPLTNNSQAITEMEFYSNVNHLGLSVAHPNHCFNSNQSNNHNDVFSAYSINGGPTAETGCLTSVSSQNQHIDEMCANNNYSNTSNFSNDQNMFLRHTIR